MTKRNEILLPGTIKQSEIFSVSIDISGKTILIVGAGSEQTAVDFSEKAEKIYLIVEEQDSLVQTRYNLSKMPGIQVRMMDFSNTDFKPGTFDIIYAQASVSNPNRNKIIKEIRRILKPGGIFCVGEIVSLIKNIPPYVKDVWDSSGISAMYTEEVEKYYEDKRFKILKSDDLSFTLKEFYSNMKNKIKSQINNLPQNEKLTHKKLLNRITHESDVYLNLGGSSVMGFKMLILQKEDN